MTNEKTNIDIKKEDSNISRWLLAGAIIGTLLSGPMFYEYFREATAKSPMLPSIPILFFIEIVKVTLFSWFAVTAGRRFATQVGLDVPVLRAISRGEIKSATEIVKKVLTVGILLGFLGFGVRLAAGFALGEASILGTLELYHNGLSIVADAVFYQFAVTLWFNWGILSLAVYAFSKLPHVSRKIAFLFGNLFASLAFGLFACLSVYGPHRGESGASRYLAIAFLLYGLPNFFFCLGIRRWGFLSAVAGVSIATLLGAAFAAFS